MNHYCYMSLTFFVNEPINPSLQESAEFSQVFIVTVVDQLITDELNDVQVSTGLLLVFGLGATNSNGNAYQKVTRTHL